MVAASFVADTVVSIVLYSVHATLFALSIWLTTPPTHNTAAVAPAPAPVVQVLPRPLLRGVSRIDRDCGTSVAPSSTLHGNGGNRNAATNTADGSVAAPIKPAFGRPPAVPPGFAPPAITPPPGPPAGAAGGSTGAPSGGASRARNFHWYGRRVSLSVALTAVAWSVDPMGALGVLPYPACTLVGHVVSVQFAYVYSLWTYFQTKSIFRQLNKPYPPVIYWCLALAPLQMGVALAAFEVAAYYTRAMPWAVAVQLQLVFTIGFFLVVGLVAAYRLRDELQRFMDTAAALHKKVASKTRPAAAAAPAANGAPGAAGAIGGATGNGGTTSPSQVVSPPSAVRDIHTADSAPLLVVTATPTAQPDVAPTIAAAAAADASAPANGMNAPNPNGASTPALTTITIGVPHSPRGLALDLGYIQRALRTLFIFAFGATTISLSFFVYVGWRVNDLIAAYERDPTTRPPLVDRPTSWALLDAVQHISIWAGLLPIVYYCFPSKAERDHARGGVQAGPPPGHVPVAPAAAVVVPYLAPVNPITPQPPHNIELGPVPPVADQGSAITAPGSGDAVFSAVRDAPKV